MYNIKQITAVSQLNNKIPGDSIIMNGTHNDLPISGGETIAEVELGSKVEDTDDIYEISNYPTEWDSLISANAITLPIKWHNTSDNIWLYGNFTSIPVEDTRVAHVQVLMLGDYGSGTYASIRNYESGEWKTWGYGGL